MQNQRGAALITALLIMALGIIIAAAMATSIHIEIARERLLQNTNQLYLTSQTVTIWAKQVLRNNALHAKQQHIQDKLPLAFHRQLNNIEIQGVLTDAQAQFNINDLADKQFVPGFINLLKTVAPNISTAQAKRLVANIQAGVSSQHKIPRKAANKRQTKTRTTQTKLARHYISISQLRTVPDMSASLLERLALYITALPEITPINLNDADAKVLHTLGNGLDKNQVQRIINLRQQLQRFSKLNQLNQLPEIAVLRIPDQQLTLTSQYFWLTTETRIQGQSLVIYRLLSRKVFKDKIVIRVLWESQGTL